MSDGHLQKSTHLGRCNSPVCCDYERKKALQSLLTACYIPCMEHAKTFFHIRPGTGVKLAAHCKAFHGCLSVTTSSSVRVCATAADQCMWVCRCAWQQQQHWRRCTSQAPSSESSCLGSWLDGCHVPPQLWQR